MKTTLLNHGAQQGFTIVELIVVVAIIGILVTFAIPQFAAYRQKAFNAATLSDVKNAKNLLEAYYAEHQRYPY